MFNQKDKTNMVTIDHIMSELSMQTAMDDPTDTVWYIDSDESLLLMVHPDYGLVLYNDEMHILGIFDREQEGELINLLDGWSIYAQSKCWREIGIDQVDYVIV